jgi:hypothetical protein
VRYRLFCQVLATVATLGWVPGNAAKLVTMVVVWGLGFGVIRAAELVAMAAVNLIFVLMNQAALKQGIFAFDHPDCRLRGRGGCDSVRKVQQKLLRRMVMVCE